ncbi:hypothetical protein FSP39_015413 [Pinctada imbricata]|uniref:G-protein coupled receptors family 1 profile domain-containing protein n=1 Tax=Pinctada imbricata TaxID=66713 RepID=A0AA89C3L0_PINIB|nr:hypothetical protein FSP39_015413 [Pinctada imbricata]
MEMTQEMDWSNMSLCYQAWYFNYSDEFKQLACSLNSTVPVLNLEDLDMLQQSEWRYFLISLYTTVIVLGFLENLLVFLVIAINKQLHTATNIFISTLAVSDIVISVFSLPFQLHYGITNHWAFGSALCHIIYPLFAVPIFVSTLTILMIAGERFILVVFPFRRKMTKRVAMTIVVVIVVISICISSPLIIFTKLQEVNIVVPEMNVHIHKSFCTEAWPSASANRSYTMFVFLVQFFIPYSAICLLYFKIYRVLKSRQLRRKEKRRNYRTTRILLAITVFFTISWLPFQIFSVMLYFSRTSVVKSLGTAYQFTDLLFKIIAMSSACINPFFYGWLNDNFRKEFGIMLGRKMKEFQMRRSGFTTTYNDENENFSIANREKSNKFRSSL